VPRWAPLALLLASGAVVAPALAKPDGTSKMPAKRPPDFEVGKTLYQQSCWQCHGETGKGDGPAAAAMPGGVASLTGKVRGEDFDKLVRLIQDGKGRMPAFAEDIDEHDSRRILQYLRDRMEGRGAPPAEDKDKDAPADEPGGGQ
jgi:mono/diheme cytochrome c family protein